MNVRLKILALITIGVILIYISPLFFNILNWDTDDVFPEVIFNTDYQSSFIRTILFSFLLTIITITISFLVGYVFRTLTKNVSLIIGSLLLVPFLIGNVSSSFLFKILLSESGLLNNAFDNSLVLYVLLGIINFWQFGTLFIYVFWINNLGVSPRVVEYVKFYKLSNFEKIKSVYLPYHRNLIILLSVFLFVSTLYESTKTQVIFRASKGTNSELISTTLYKAYLSDTKISPDFAERVLFAQTGLFYLPVFLVCTFLLYIIISAFIKRLSTTKLNISFDLLAKVNFEKPLFIFVKILVVSPLISVFFIQDVSFNNISFLLQPISLSTITSIILLLVFVLPLSYFLRIEKMKFFYAINNRSISIFLLLFILFLVPPLVLMLFGFEWSSIFSVRGSTATYTLWIIGQCINSLPVIATFVFVIHFIVNNNELEYLKIMKLSNNEIIKWSFLKRFKIEYVMTLLFAFSIIFNEGTFNKVYSDRVPSYVSEILRTVSSRNANYSDGMMFLFFSITLAVICVILWNIVLSKLSKNKI